MESGCNSQRRCWPLERIVLIGVPNIHIKRPST